MSETISKEDVREIAKEMVHSLKLTGAVIDVEYPGAYKIFMDVFYEELQKLLSEKASDVAETDCERYTCDAAAKEEAVGMTFGDALEALKKGCYVARKGWNGKNQYVMLATCISYKGSTGEIVNCHHNAIGNKALAFVGTSGVQMGWLASQADMLAEDWYIV